MLKSLGAGYSKQRRQGSKRNTFCLLDKHRLCELYIGRVYTAFEKRRLRDSEQDGIKRTYWIVDTRAASNYGVKLSRGAQRPLGCAGPCSHDVSGAPTCVMRMCLLQRTNLPQSTLE